MWYDIGQMLRLDKDAHTKNGRGGHSSGSLGRAAFRRAARAAGSVSGRPRAFFYDATSPHHVSRLESRNTQLRAQTSYGISWRRLSRHRRAQYCCSHSSQDFAWRQVRFGGAEASSFEVEKRLNTRVTGSLVLQCQSASSEEWHECL